MVNLPHCGIHKVNQERWSQLHPGNKQTESLEHKQFQDEELAQNYFFFCLFLSLLNGILQSGIFQGESRMRKSWGQGGNVYGVCLCVVRNASCMHSAKCLAHRKGSINAYDGMSEWVSKRSTVGQKGWVSTEWVNSKERGQGPELPWVAPFSWPFHSAGQRQWRFSHPQST